VKFPEIYFCTLIQNLLLCIVPKQSLILFLQCTADSSYATTGSAVVLVKSCNDPNVDEVVLVMEEQSVMTGLQYSRRRPISG